MGSIKFFKKDFRCFGGFSHAFHRYSKADLEVKRGFTGFILLMDKILHCPL